MSPRSPPRSTVSLRVESRSSLWSPTCRLSPRGLYRHGQSRRRETAAYLIGEWLGDAKAKILATLSSNRFRGEEEREIGFRRALRTRYPNLGLVEASEGLGIDQPPARSCARRSPPIPTLQADSIGGEIAP